MEAKNDPEKMPEFANLSDDEFVKRSVRYNATREVFAFSTILSLNYNKIKGRKQPAFMQGVLEYAILKAEQNLKNNTLP